MAQVQPNTEEGEKMADGGILLQGESSEALKRGWSATITTIGRGWIYFMVLVFVITFPAAIVGAYGAARHALLAATAVPIAIFCWVLFVQLVQSSVCLADRLPSRRKQPSQVFLDALRSAVTVAIVVLASVLALAFLIIPGVFQGLRPIAVDSRRR